MFKAGEMGPQEKAARAVTFVFAAVIFANLLSRSIIGVAVHDQAKLILLSEEWRWSYDDEMPVYQWLATALLRVTAYELIFLDLLKYLFVAIAATSLFVLGRRMSGSGAGGAVAAFAAFLIPTFHEDFLREYAHTAALIAFSLWSLIFFVKDGGRIELPGWSPALGLVWAAGILSKHAMLLLIAAQWLALWRLGRLGDGRWRGLAATTVLTLVLVAPVYFLLFLGRAEVVHSAAEFMGEASPFDRFRGLADLASSFLAEGALLLILTGIAYTLHRRTSSASSTPVVADEPSARRFLLLIIAAILLLFAIGILAANVYVVRDRWMAQPLVLLAPLAVAWFADAVAACRVVRLAQVLGSIVLLVGLVRATEPFANGLSGKVEDENVPWRAVANAVGERAGEGDVVVSTNPEAAATLKLMRSDLRTFSSITADRVPADADTLWFVSTDKNPRNPVEIPPGWRCAAPERRALSYRYVEAGTFEVAIARCVRRP